MRVISVGLARFLRCAAAIGFVGCALLAQPGIRPANAADAGYPSHPIRMIVPFAAGGAADLVARVGAGYLSVELGQPIQIDNRGGAGGTIGSQLAAHAQPDGYTLVSHSVSSAVLNGLLYKSLPYDLRRDFVPITRYGIGPTFVVVNTKLGVSTLQEFIALARANPGKVKYGSSGIGAIMHLSGEHLAKLAGVELLHVPYRGEGQVLSDLISNQLQMEVSIASAVYPLIQAGQLKALSVNSKQRSALMPEVPTSAEAGVPGFESSNWYGLYAPKGTPQPIIDRIHAAMTKVVRNPQVQERLRSIGVEPIQSTPEELAKYWDEQFAYWEPVVKASGAKLD